MLDVLCTLFSCSLCLYRILFFLLAETHHTNVTIPLKKKKKCKLIHLCDSQQWLPFNSFQLQDFVQQWWRTGQGDWKGTSGGGLWDVRQGFGSVDCSALCRAYHSHPDIPKHHWAYHELPQQDQAGEERTDYHSKTSPLSVFDNVMVFSRFVLQDLRVYIVDIFVSNFYLHIFSGICLPF